MTKTKAILAVATFVTAMVCLGAGMVLGQAQTSEHTIATRKQQVLWNKLSAEIQKIDENLDGAMGVAIEDLTTGQKFLLHEDELFPQASSIKIAVLAELYREDQLSAARAVGKAKLTDMYTVEANDLVQDSDIMLGLTPGSRALQTATWRQ